MPSLAKKLFNVILLVALNDPFTFLPLESIPVYFC